MEGKEKRIATFMLLLFTNNITERLKYVCRFLFEEQLGITVQFSNDIEAANRFQGPVIHYGARESNLTVDHYSIIPQGLLSESDIKSQPINCKRSGSGVYFFETNGGNHPFDILSAIFYLISRYEEYLTSEKDEYGRYPHTAALAYREDFLKEPLINKWIIDLDISLKKSFPNLKTNRKSFRFLPTYDIDIAYAYKGKGLFRNLGGFLLSPGAERILVLVGNKLDPFDTYAELDEMHKKKGLNPIYFFLVAGQRGKYDKNINRTSRALIDLINDIGKRYPIGLHPSWISNDKVSLLHDEKQFLEKISGEKITRSRQHYIKFNLPQTYRQLLNEGITDDFSMGYGTVNGFRASVAESFLWYDLEQECETSLRIHPYCFMEANCYYEQKQSADQALEELLYYLKQCKEANGELVTIFHNNFIGRSKEFAGWGDMYKRFLEKSEFSGT